MPDIQRLITLTTIAAGSLLSGFSQHAFKVDTLPTGRDVDHIMLSINIPNGESYIRASQICGKSIAKISCAEQSAHYNYHSYVDPNGNMHRKVSLTASAARSDAAGLAPMANVCKSSYLPDASTSTDLNMELGLGRSRLDLSGMMLNRVNIQSMFSDVHIDFNTQNKMRMKVMEIHAAKAKVTIKNVELARAEMISVQNDMGDTQLIFGSPVSSGEIVTVQQGMGDCTFVIHPGHPVRLILKSGIFNSPNLPAGYTKVSSPDGLVYINEALNKKAGVRFTTIICKIDMGSITVLDMMETR